MSKVALVTGITGQDGAYLSQLLLQKGYTVYGAHRRSASAVFWRLQELGLADEIQFVPLELLEMSNLLRLIEQVRPDEIYNLAAQSFVTASFEQPIYSGDVDGLGVARLLEAVRVVNPQIRFYQASSSEMFGKVQAIPQTETTPFHPRSPYAAAKLYAHWMVVNYREAYDMFAVSGILFNHESPLRGVEFVTRKITTGLARIRHGQQVVLQLGNLEAQRDWGYAAEYVDAMWRMLQQEAPDDFVIATGATHTIREFVDAAAAAAGFTLSWRGTGVQTEGIDAATGRVIVQVDRQFYRPAEVDLLLGSAEKARRQLGWTPRTTFAELVVLMMRADLDRVGRIGNLIRPADSATDGRQESPARH